MIYFITGGASSGKSAYAESLVTELSQDAHKTVFYLATSTNNDEAMQAKVEKHQQRRPDDWQLIEEPLLLADQLNQINKANHIVLIDCMTLYLTNWLFGETPKNWLEEQQNFLTALNHFLGDVIVVSNEIGSGVIPMGQLTRDFVEAAGSLNQEIASLADKATLVVSGLPLALKGT